MHGAAGSLRSRLASLAARFARGTLRSRLASLAATRLELTRYPTPPGRSVQRITCTLTEQHLQVVTFAIFDQDLGSGDDPMGVVELNLQDYSPKNDEEAGTCHDEWKEVIGCKGCNGATGRLHLKTIWLPELSPEEMARRAEEARRKLYEKEKGVSLDLGWVVNWIKS